MIIHQALLIDGFLSKIAGDEDTDYLIKERLKNLGIGYGAAVGGGAIGIVLGGVAAIPIIRETLKADPTAKYPKETKKLIGSFMKKHKVYPNLNMGRYMMAGEYTSGFRGKLQRIQARSPKFLSGLGISLPGKNINPATILHELGHAVDFKKHPRPKAMARGVAPAVGVVAGMGLMASKDPEKRKYAPLAVAGGYSPMLYQEGKASVLAMKHLMKHQGKLKGLASGLKHLGPAGLSYLAVPAGIAGAMALVNAYRKRKANTETPALNS